MIEGVASEVWLRYNVSRDVALRNDIVVSYVNLVKCVVLKMREACGCAEVDDLVSCGMLTLIDCVERFDVTRNVKFETFASIKIRGSVIDYIRKQDWVPRNLRKSAKAVEEAYQKLSGDENENIEEKVAKHLGVTVFYVREMMSEVCRFNIISYEQLVYDALSGDKFELPDRSQSGRPDAELLLKEFMEKLETGLAGLLEREKLVLALYYTEQLKLKEIARIFEVTESRVCQIHGRALKKLKEKLSAYLK